MNRIVRALLVLLSIAGISAVGTVVIEYVLNVPSAPSNNGVLTSMVITASDPFDPGLRTWDVTIDRPMPPMGEGGYHHGADFIEPHVSGDTMSFQWTFSTGVHYLVFDVTQTGGPEYGTYSGTIAVNGQVRYFDGLDGSNYVTIEFTIPSPPG